MKYTNLILLLIFFLGACREQDSLGESPYERNQKSINNLRNELVNAPYGWKMIYFPKTDSLLFSNKDEIIENIPDFDYKFGYGGHYFTMKFNGDGSLKMLHDANESSIKNIRSSEFEIRQNTYTQLSFTTPNYIHTLVNEHFGGTSDFLYYGKDINGDLVFKTSTYSEPAREYIVLQKLDEEEDFHKIIEKSYSNRIFFEKMKSPQITIRKGSKIFFQSDMPIKSYFLDSEKKRAAQMEYQRYYYFRYNKKPNVLTGGAIESNALGSGYVGTERGLLFRTGIRYNPNFIFYDFERQGNTFVCELVRVYDPIRKRYHTLSKHLAPANAEPTGMIAEIKL